MNNNDLLDLYTDYLISSFGATTGVGLARLLDGAVSHDRIQRYLAGPRKDGAEYWKVVKRYVREMESVAGVLIVDDSIVEKPHTDENELVSWHYDHTSGQTVKGINFVTALYHSQGVSLPVGYHLVSKTEEYIDAKTGQVKRRSAVTKNEVYRQLVQQAQANHMPFRYVVNDVWFASADNMLFVKHDLQRDFVMPLKTNRKVSVSVDAKNRRQYVRVDTLGLEAATPLTVYLEGVDFPLTLVKQVFTNADGSVGMLLLVTSDPDLTYDGITSTYRTRWHVEPYHKSLKQNAALAASPTKTPTTQANHIFASLCAYLKLEMLKLATHTNHFALKSRLYVRALHTAFESLRQLDPIRLSA